MIESDPEKDIASQKLELQIAGMECASCEVLLERKFKSLAGVKHANVNHATGKATLTCSGIPSKEELQNAVKDTKYSILDSIKEEKENKQKVSTANYAIKRSHIEIGGIFLIIVAIYLILKYLNILPNIGISDNMSYGFVFLIGLVAAFSTCAAVAGGLLLSVSTKYNEMHPDLTSIQKFKPHIYFNIGRILSYTILGGLLGAIGTLLTLSSKVNGIITIFASIVMLILGLQLLNIFPWLNRFKLKMPKFIAHKIHDSSASKGKAAPFALGASTFFLPCGFTQALQLYVLSVGSIVTGALTMLAFSIGTLPSLVSIGAISSFSKGKFKHYFVKFTAVLVILLAIYNVNNGLALTGNAIDFNSLLPSVKAEDTTVQLLDGKQIVEMKVDGYNYYPSHFTVVEDVPVEWRIDGKGAQGCTKVITIPKLGINEYLPNDQIKTITFIPKETGTLQFSCSMGMAGPGAFIVVPNTQGIKGAEIIDDSKPKNIPSNGQAQKLSMEISRERGFYPREFTVKKNIPVELEIDSKLQLGGCMSVMVIPDYDVAHRIPIGKSTLTFTPTKAGTVDITCSMGSRMGRFNVVN